MDFNDDKRDGFFTTNTMRSEYSIVLYQTLLAFRRSKTLEPFSITHPSQSLTFRLKRQRHSALQHGIYPRNSTWQWRFTGHNRSMSLVTWYVSRNILYDHTYTPSDGGGVRGLSTLLILKALMTRVNAGRAKAGKHTVKPCDIFDMIGGTSTGG
jgi:hypothetical protein